MARGARKRSCLALASLAWAFFWLSPAALGNGEGKGGAGKKDGPALVAGPKEDPSAAVEVRLPDGTSRYFWGKRFLVGSSVPTAKTVKPGLGNSGTGASSTAARALGDIQRVVFRNPPQSTSIGGTRGGQPASLEEVRLALEWAPPGAVEDATLSAADREGMEECLAQVMATGSDTPPHLLAPRLAAAMGAWGQRRSALELMEAFLDDPVAGDIPAGDVELFRAHLRSQFLPLTVRTSLQRRNSQKNWLPWDGKAPRAGDTGRFSFTSPFPVFWALCYWDGGTLRRADPEGALPALASPAEASGEGRRAFAPSSEFRPKTGVTIGPVGEDTFYIVASADPAEFEALRLLDEGSLLARAQAWSGEKTTAFGAVLLRLTFLPEKE